MLAAISSISATQRQPFTAAESAESRDRSSSEGCDIAHSASSASSTPSTLASPRAASSSAAVPLVHAA